MSFKNQLEKIKDIHKGNKLPSVNIPGDFNFCDIGWPDRLSKSGSPLRLSEGEKFIEILNDYHLKQFVHFQTREWTLILIRFRKNKKRFKIVLQCL